MGMAKLNPEIPTRGPTWTFFVLMVLALVTLAATIIGMIHAGAAH